MAIPSFANRFDGISGSAIREIFKLITKPDIISFAGGNPASSALPDELVQQMAFSTLKDDGKRILQYGATEGYPPFLHLLNKHLNINLGFEFENNIALPTTGSTQAMDLLCKVYLNPGDVVLAENPTFLGNLQCLKLYQANVIGIESDEYGINIDQLEEAVIKHKPKMLYTIPNFQNPSGVCLIDQRREYIAKLANKYNFIVAEDDPYRDLRYNGEHIPTIKSHDKWGNVLYMGSFSKIISPGLRLGYIYGNKDIIRKCTIAKQSTDVHTSNLSQAIVCEFLKSGKLEDNIKRICEDYSQKMNTMTNCLNEFENIEYVQPQGGMFVFIKLQKDINAINLLQKAIEQGIAYVPGAYFYVNGGYENTLRLNFTNSTLENINKGMYILKNTIIGGI